MKPHAKTALALALAIVGGIAAGMRCDASEWVENSSQTNLRGAAYTVKHIQKGLTLLSLGASRPSAALQESPPESQRIVIATAAGGRIMV